MNHVVLLRPNLPVGRARLIGLHRVFRLRPVLDFVDQSFQPLAFRLRPRDRRITTDSK